MVAANPESSGRLADTLESLFHSVLSSDNAARKVALVVIDGLGAELLAGYSGHARFLSSAWRERGWVVDSGLPSTTAAALASITTGASSGSHGLLGYQVLDPQTGQLVNHLKEFPPGVNPDSWQSLPTIFERARQEGIDSVAIAEARFAGTDFTRAILRGARLVGCHTLDSHHRELRDFFDSSDTALAYLYWPGLDRIGHHRGTEHPTWRDQLESIDEFAREVESALVPGEQVWFTADHGMVDVGQADHVVVPANHPLRSQVAHWGGEPRFLHLYLHPDFQASDVVSQWQSFFGERATVLSRDDAAARSLFGPLAPAHRGRIGDLIVCAEARFAIYDELTSSSASREMVGQHGSWTAAETRVPVIPLATKE